MPLEEKHDLDELIMQGIKEGERWEFKLAWPANEKIEETVSAFANTSGGIILIGVEYDNVSDSIRGFPGIAKTRNLTEKAIHIGGNISPRLTPSSWWIDIDAAGTTAVQVIEVNKSRGAPHMASSGRFYMRADKINAIMPEAFVEKLYMTRQSQAEQSYKIVTEKNYFLPPPGANRWMSICFCPSYLERNIIGHSRLNYDFLNAIRTAIDRNLCAAFFGSFIDGYILHLDDRFWKIFHHGLLAYGISMIGENPRWERIEDWLTKTIEMYSQLLRKFKYPGFTEVTLAINGMRGHKIFFEDGRMNALSQNPGVEELLWSYEFEDNDILQSPNRVKGRFFTGVLAAHRLDEYIS